jgi:tol-pal system beta propeller repeat protein TolB
MESRSRFFTNLDKLLLLGSGCGTFALCAVLGVFFYLWQNPPRVGGQPAPTQALGFPTLIPGFTATAFDVAPTPTLPVFASETLGPTLVPSPLPAFFDNPRPAGKIVYTCFVKEIDQICIMNADGSGQTQITQLKATAFYASLSPNGEMVYFSSRQSGNFEIYSIQVDGNEMKRLTKGLGALYAPELSPDRQQIVFTNGSAGIWVMKINGNAPRAITTKDDIDPTWSPDGSRIAFASSRQGKRQLFIMDADGSNIRQVTNLDEMGGRSSWSPDGKKLAFYAGPAGDHNIYTINIDGTGLVQLTHGGDNLGPSWSPDGNWVAFTSFRDGNNEIYIMRPDGTNPMRLTSNLTSEWQPRWGK